jgi:uncharacterized protein YjbI with pentapeptide repeats
MSGVQLIDLINLDADLSGIDITQFDLTGVDLQRAIVLGADLWGVSVADLLDTGADLEGISIKYCDLEGVSMEDLLNSKADLTDLDLKDVDLGDVHVNDLLKNGLLLRIDPMALDLSGVNVTSLLTANVNLSGVPLRDASLRRAKLRTLIDLGANLEGATVFGCDLSGTNLEDLERAGVEIDARTRLYFRPLRTKLKENLPRDAFVRWTEAELEELDAYDRGDELALGRLTPVKRMVALRVAAIRY